MLDHLSQIDPKVLENTVHDVFIIFIYFWLCWVFIAAHGLSLLSVSREYSSCQVWPLTVVFSLIAE